MFQKGLTCLTSFARPRNAWMASCASSSSDASGNWLFKSVLFSTNHRSKALVFLESIEGNKFWKQINIKCNESLILRAALFGNKLAYSFKSIEGNL